MARANTLMEIWNTYNDNIINEGKKDRPIDGGIKNMSTKPGPGAVDLNDEKSKNKQHSKSPGNTEPAYEIEGLDEPIDPKNAKKEDELYNSADYSSEKYNENDRKIEKKVKESINNYMKSTFNKLFENVMGDDAQELEALGIDTEVEADADTDVGETDEVTVTLGASHIEALKEILAQIEPDEDDDEGDDEGEDESEEGFNFYSEDEEDEDEEDEDTVDEATEMTAVPDTAGQGLTQPGHNKVGKLKAKGKKASDSTKKYVDGEPKPLADGKDKLTSKANKVALSQGDFIQ